ncbi:MAG TPA: molecular chaperone TorD family protein [Nitrospirota bacterium]
MFLEEKTLESLSVLLGRVCPEAALFGEKMKDALLEYTGDELLVEYAKLFVGPFELKAAPYGSIYLEEGRKIMGDTTLEVTRIYKEEGLSLDDNYRELPDHIAAELEFMYYLAYHEVEALANNAPERAAHFLDRQEHFLRTFLGGWVEPFCDKIRQGTENDYYKALAGCLSVFITKTHFSDALPEELKMGLART